MKKRESFGLFLVGSVLIYWGFTTVMMKHALLYMSPVTYIMVRFLAASAPLLVLYGRKLRLFANPRLILHGCILGILEMVPMQTSTLSLNYTSTANSVFVSQLSFVFVPLIQCFFVRKPPSRRLWFTVVFLLLGLGIFSDVLHSGIGAGSLLSVVTAIFRSISILCLKRFTATDDAKLLGVLQVLFCALSSIPVWLAMPGSVQWCAPSIAILFFTGILGSAAAFVIYNAGQALTTPIKVSFLNLIQPVFAMLGAAVLADPSGHVEAVTSNMIIGSILILATLAGYLIAENSGHLSPAFCIHRFRPCQNFFADNHRQNE